MSNEIESAESTESESSSCYEEGSLLQFQVNTGYREFGSVLKVIYNSELRDYDSDLPIEVTQDFNVVGTYHLGEVAQKVSTDQSSRPNLYLMPARIESEDKCILMYHDDMFDDELKERLYKDLLDIASKDDGVNDRINELLRLSVMACMTSEMAKSSARQIQEALKNQDNLEEVEVEVEGVSEEV